MKSQRRAFFRKHRSPKTRRAFVRKQARTLRRLQRAVDACRNAEPPPPRLTEPQVLPFYPQAGILWQDLYFGNFVDLDPGPGTLDWACGHQTYDGHSGQDTTIRSFQEKRIGVPVFAALDGKVLEVQDGLLDEHYGTTTTPVDNHVILTHFGGQMWTVYGHLALHSIPVRAGDRVVAGEQLGLTASSGNSSWPHLHFTVKFHDDPIEPFAGPCRPGRSYWASQPQLPTEPYVRDFTFSPNPFGGRADPPWDEAVRTGTFVAGVRDVYFRVELGFFSGGPAQVTFVRPDGSIALSAERPTALEGYRATWASWHERPDLDQLGRWRLRLALGGRTLVDTPFDVVATPAEVHNRAPSPVSVELATPDEVPQCIVRTSLTAEDPDYDIVRYRYRWTVGGSTVRTVTSAALSDVLRRDLVRAGETLACEVTPSDGSLSGPPASASVG